jgi:glycosyltransferase involved in cell wall biosynthesis
MYDWSRHLEYIPNFAAISEQNVIEKKWQRDNSDSGVVLFARRFVIQRGVYLWADCVSELAPRFPKVEFRFVGYGDGESHLKPLVQKHPNVSFYSRHHHEIQREHESAHIEVVPSLWSEGTSLSCLEAMAAGCALVCSDVGGLGNLVMPGYNGLILPPRIQFFTKAVADLLHNPQKASEMGHRAYQVAKMSFSREAWENRVESLLEDVWRHPEAAPLARRWRP